MTHEEILAGNQARVLLSLIFVYFLYAVRKLFSTIIGMLSLPVGIAEPLVFNKLQVRK
jgi:hypothetical protein